MPEPSSRLRLASEEILRLLLSVDQSLLAFSAADAYLLYERVHQTAAQIAPIDAFYVALYLAEDAKLFFVYNEDSGVYDEPVTVPMGNGPTSTVIRERRSLILTPQTAATQRNGIPFGDTQRISLSAIHVPIFAEGKSDQPVLGVLSAQSYCSGVYGDAFVQVLEWLAARVGIALFRQTEQEEFERLRGSEQARRQERRRQMVDLSDTFIQMLVSITKETEALRSLVPAHQTKLRRATDALCRTCYRCQTETSGLPLRLAADKPTSATAADPTISSPNVPSEPFRLRNLSEREREVADLLANGLSNAAIAERLHVSPNTVKHHVKGILQKLDVENRTDVARIVVLATQIAPPPG